MPGRHNPGMTDLQSARTAYEERSWLDAHDAFARADAETPLEAEDLELYATTGRMLGRDDDALATLERAHHGYLERGETYSSRVGPRARPDNVPTGSSLRSDEDQSSVRARVMHAGKRRFPIHQAPFTL